MVEWALTDVPAGAGGFMCVPGSHRLVDYGSDANPRLSFPADAERAHSPTLVPAPPNATIMVNEIFLQKQLEFQQHNILIH